MNVLQMLNKEYAKALNEIKGVADDSSEYALNLANKISLLEEIGGYINSYKWLKHKKTIARAKFLIDSDFDYTEFCEHFRVSYEAARTSLSYILGQLESKIGENTAQLISQGKVAEAEALFKFRSGQLTIADYIIPDAMPLIPEAKYHSFSLDACENELRVLAIYSKAYYARLRGVIDPEKMECLRNILEGDNAKRAEDRLDLLRVINKEITVDDFLEEVENRKKLL